MLYSSQAYVKHSRGHQKHTPSYTKTVVSKADLQLISPHVAKPQKMYSYRQKTLWLNEKLDPPKTSVFLLKNHFFDRQRDPKKNKNDPGDSAQDKDKSSSLFFRSGTKPWRRFVAKSSGGKRAEDLPGQLLKFLHRDLESLEISMAENGMKMAKGRLFICLFVIVFRVPPIKIMSLSS